MNVREGPDETGNHPDASVIAPWLRALTAADQEKIIASVGGLSILTPREKVAFFLADFHLCKDETYLHGRKVRTMPQETLETIIDYCFYTLNYAPMLYYNTRFSTKYQVQKVHGLCPDLSMTDIMTDKVLAFREKKNGVLVTSAVISHGEHSIIAWVGGLSCPRYIAGIRRFELVNDKAFSIEPFNAEGKIVFPTMDIEFQSRMPTFSVLPDWEEGAIALVSTPAAPVEKRIKRVSTAEILVQGGVAVDQHGTYPMSMKVPQDGVYECAWDGSQLIPTAYRPWKEPTRNFFRAIGVPTVHSLKSLGQRKVIVGPGGLRVNRTTLFVPEPLIFSPVLTAFLSFPMATARLYASSTPTEAIPATVHFRVTKFDVELSESALVGKYYPGSSPLLTEATLEEGQVHVPPRTLFVHPQVPEGMVISTAASKYIKLPEGWRVVTARGVSIEIQADYKMADFQRSHRWALSIPYYACRFYKETAPPPSLERWDSPSGSLMRAPLFAQPTGRTSLNLSEFHVAEIGGYDFAKNRLPIPPVQSSLSVHHIDRILTVPMELTMLHQVLKDQGVIVTLDQLMAMLSFYRDRFDKDGMIFSRKRS